MKNLISTRQISSRPQQANISTPFREFPDSLAFAALLIFSRTLDTPLLGLSLYPAASGQALFAQLALSDGFDLAQAQQCLDIKAVLDPDFYAVDFSIRPWHPDNRDGSEDTLFYKSLPEDGLELILHHGKTFKSTLAANDLLEKISLILNRLDQQPHCPLNELSLLTSFGKQLIPDPGKPIPRSHYETTPEVFRRVASQYALEPAITDGDRTYNYQALKNAAEYLAAKLIEAGLKQGDTVLISGPSSFGTIAGFVAVMLAGGVLVSLDPSLPEDRQHQIVELSEAHLAIFATATSEALPDLTLHQIAIPAWPTPNELSHLVTAHPPAVILNEDANAYMFFTSGSTGTPKGVLGWHQGLAHFLDWQRREFPIGPGDRSAQITALSFDVVLRDLFYPLTSGACIYIPERSMVFDARKILAWMHDHQITLLHSVPSLMKAWLQSDIKTHPLQSLNYVFFAGEPLTDELLKRFQSAASAEVNIINLYGPTETTLAKLFNRLTRIEPGVQPIGKPQPGVDVLILNDRKTICGLDEVGEIVIRTPYRSKGYFKNPDQTNEVFIPNPWRHESGDLIYCTGDLGKYREDGKIQIFGRIDAQIKIRGVRIEPNEIETHILKHPGVSNVAVTARVGGNQEKTLYAFVELTTHPDIMQFNREMREFLRASLPEVMIPKRLIPIDNIPHLPNGKVNRKALASLEIEENGGDENGLDTSSISDDTRMIVAGFEKALGFKIHDLNASFIDHGGDSLSFIQASLVVEKALGWLPVDWEKTPIIALSRTSAPSSSTIREVATSSILRAVSITFIVLFHFTQIKVSTTAILFIVSGYSFGRFQMQNILKTGSVKSIVRTIAKIALPTFSFIALKQILLKDFVLQNLLLIGNLVPLSVNHFKNYWFVEELMQCLLILAVLLSFSNLRKAFSAHPVASALLGSFICILASYTLQTHDFHDSFYHGMTPLSALWLIFLGIAIAQAKAQQIKWLLLVTTYLFAYFVSLLPDVDKDHYSGVSALAFGLAIAALLFIQKVRMPRLLSTLINTLAASSLFIYLVHHPLGVVIQKRFPDHLQPLFIVILIFCGVLTWKIWNTGSEWLQRRFIKRFTPPKQGDIVGSM